MHDTVAILIALVTGYLFGSIPIGYIAGRILKVPLHTHGSGSTGALNTMRALGPKISFFVLFGDALKGFIATTIILAIYLDTNTIVVPAVAIFAVIGHIWPIWIDFKGGKGVATGLGAFSGMAVFEPLLFLFVLGGIVLVVGISLITRYVSLAVLIVFPLVTIIFTVLNFSISFSQRDYLVATLGITLLVVYAHLPNIKRLIKGNERRLSFKKQPAKKQPAKKQSSKR